MVVINLAPKPLTAAHRQYIARLANEDVERVVHVPFAPDLRRPLLPQVQAVVDAIRDQLPFSGAKSEIVLGLTSEQYALALILVELMEYMGFRQGFPPFSMMRLRF